MSSKVTTLQATTSLTSSLMAADPSKACPLEELLMKKGLIANSITEHPLMIRLRNAISEKCTGSAAPYTEIERFIRTKKVRGDRYLLRAEFVTIASGISSSISSNEIEQLFNAFRSDKADAIFSDEFYNALKGPMSGKRREILNIIFNHLDCEGRGYIEPEVLLDSFDSSRHPDVLSQSKSKDTVRNDFFRNFDVSQVVDGKIHRDDFFNYYGKISACIVDEFQFELQVKNVWRISNRQPLSYVPGSVPSKPSMNSSPRNGNVNGAIVRESVSGFPTVERISDKRESTSMDKYESKSTSISMYDAQQSVELMPSENRRFNDSSNTRQQFQFQNQPKQFVRSESSRQYEANHRYPRTYEPSSPRFESNSPRFEEMEQPYFSRSTSPRSREEDFPVRSLGASVGTAFSGPKNRDRYLSFHQQIKVPLFAAYDTLS
jgi:Ca2+-binding EF-hand superfamily protein